MRKNSLKTVIGVFAAVSRLVAVQLGDTRDAVFAEKGTPVGRMTAGDVELLRYRDVTIKLRDGHVFAVDKVVAPPPVAPSASVNQQVGPPANPAHAPVDVAEPVFPRRFVGGPEFQTSAGTREAGTAFLARMPGNPQVYILTVHHLLGPMGGFARLISHAEVPAFVQSIRLHELFGEPTLYPVSGCVVPYGGDPKGSLPELAAFRTNGAAAENVAVLAADPPTEGEAVWVVAHVLGGVPEGELLHRARATAYHEEWLSCRFDNPNIITNGASGAPVVNARGEIVGVYQGHWEENGSKYASIIPSTLIIATLRNL
jgi:Trypsin-like peptidase domain